MLKTHLRSALAAAILSCAALVPAHAIPLHVTFDNVTGLVAGPVTIKFEVSDTDGTNAATSAILTAFPAADLGYGAVGDDLFATGVVGGNGFTFSGGALTDIAFLWFQNGSTAVVVDTAGAFLGSPLVFADVLNAGNYGATGVQGDLSSLTVSAAVPLPASGAIALAGLAGLAALRRRS